MRIAILGVRGSTPATGRDFAGYGGDTSCLAVIVDGDERPRLVLDAGTGLQSLPRLLGDAAFNGDIVLSHLHWDHIQGLPFCPSVDNPAAQVTLHVPTATSRDDAAALLAGSMSPPHFPIGPDRLLGRWQFAPLVRGRVALRPESRASVTVAPIEHKGGIALGIRVEADGVEMAYLPDHALNGDPRTDLRAATELARGVDLLVHDGQYLDSEAAIARSYGHATIEAALTFADACGVGKLLLTHHSPGRTDADVAELSGAVRRTPGGIPVRFARQGALLRVGAQTPTVVGKV